MKECKLRSGVSWKGALRQNRRKTFGRKTRPTCSNCPGNFKSDTSPKCSAWLPIFMFTEFNSVPGNEDPVSVHCDDEITINVTPAEEAAGFTDTLYVHCRTTTEVSQNSPPIQLCHATRTFRARPNFFSIPEIGFDQGFKRRQ